MRSQKKIVVEIDSDGNCSIDGQNFIGSECSHFIEEIESTLGQRTSIKDKPEYRQKQAASNRNIQRSGR